MKVSIQMYFLAMLSIFCFFFRRGREEEDVPTRDEVDWETWWNIVLFKYYSFLKKKKKKVLYTETLREWRVSVCESQLELLYSLTHFTHDLSPIEHHFVSLAEAVFGSLLSF